MPDPEPFLALITPVDPSNAPDQGLPGGLPPMVGGGPIMPEPEPPVGLWPPLPPDLPTQLPIFGGWKPGTIWPPLNPPSIDNTLPGGPPPTIGGGPITPEPPSIPVAPDQPPGVPPTVGGGPITPDQPPPTVGGGPVEPPPTVGGGPIVPPPTVGGGPVTPSTTLVLLAWVPGSGFRWVVVDTSLSPDNSLPPTAQPK